MLLITQIFYSQFWQKKEGEKDLKYRENNLKANVKKSCLKIQYGYFQKPPKIFFPSISKKLKIEKIFGRKRENV